MTLLLGMTHTGALPAISLLNQGLYPHALAESQTLQCILTQAHPESEVLCPSWQGSLKGGMQNSQVLEMPSLLWHLCHPKMFDRCQSRYSVRRVRNLDLAAANCGSDHSAMHLRQRSNERCENLSNLQCPGSNLASAW